MFETHTRDGRASLTTRIKNVDGVRALGRVDLHGTIAERLIREEPGDRGRAGRAGVDLGGREEAGDEQHRRRVL